ncbi:RAM signaling pathway protein-domain-containing protein [Myxozyma melibiosi]|uniref:RAM signaling pathway protein-domain-containing protein n=1 Tax=Myxozyma melibiosi TaxID=54550 RepID=A0ABR1F1U0_9ASCO
MSASAPVERSRSNSESIVTQSSRAAKRMGFVVSRRNQDLSNVPELSRATSDRILSSSSSAAVFSGSALSSSHNTAPSSATSSATSTTTSTTRATSSSRAPPPQIPPSFSFSSSSSSSANGISPHHLPPRPSLSPSSSTDAPHTNATLAPASSSSYKYRQHSRGISHDSIMEFSYPAIGERGGNPLPAPGSVPLAATSSSSSNSSTSSNHSTHTIRDRDRNDSAASSSSTVSGSTVTSAASGKSHKCHKSHKSNGSAGFGVKEASNLDVESQPNAYFKRLSVMKEEHPHLTVPSPTAATFPATAHASHAQSSMIMFSTQIVESSRSILFSISQLLPAVRHFLAFCDDKKLSSVLANIIYGSKIQIDNLVRSLEHHDALLASTSANAAAAAAAAAAGGKTAARGTPPIAAAHSIEPVIHATLTCLHTFKHVVSLVQGNIRSLASRAEIRHTRSFFLLLFGTLAEVRNAWNTLLPALEECRTPVYSYLSNNGGGGGKVLASVVRSQSAARQRSPQPLQYTSAPPHLSSPNGLATPNPSTLTIENMPPPLLPSSMNLPTPSFLPQTPHSIGSQKKIPPAIITSLGGPAVQHPPTPGYFATGVGGPAIMSPTVGSYYVPSTPMESGPVAFHFPMEPSEGDDELFDRINNAIQSANSVLSLVLGGIAAEVGSGGGEKEQPDYKMLDLRSMCEMGLDITGQLKVRLTTIRDGDYGERQRFGEETNTFVRVIINILEFTKTILSDYNFLSEARPQLSSLTRVTKEVLTGALRPSEKSSATAASTMVATPNPTSS